MRIINYTIFMLLPLVPVNADALGKVYSVAFQQNLQVMADKQPRYVWGACDYEKTDCSGMVYICAKRAGMPVERTTANWMRYGRGGWSGRDVGVQYIEELSLQFYTWQDRPDRPHGHVSIAFRYRTAYPQVIHASQGRGHVVVEPFEGKLKRDCSAVRILTIGDK